MEGINYLSAFFIGLAGGVHCVGMCGGIVAALRMVSPKGANAIPYTLAYNMGRIASYTLAGAITGALGKIAADYVPLANYALSLLSGIMLFLYATTGIGFLLLIPCQYTFVPDIATLETSLSFFSS